MLPEISTSLEEAHLKEEELLTARGFQSPGASWMDGCFPICFLVKQIGALLKGVLKRSHFNLIPMSWIQLLRWRSDLTAMMAVMSATFTKRAPDVAGSLEKNNYSTKMYLEKYTKTHISNYCNCILIYIYTSNLKHLRTCKFTGYYYLYFFLTPCRFWIRCKTQERLHQAGGEAASRE